MNRKLLFLLIFGFTLTPLFSLEIHVAPISYIDSRAERVVSNIEVSKDIAREAERYLTGKNLFFRYIKSEGVNAPVSVIDAIALSRLERVEYLVYGFVEKREYTYRAELRLLDFAGREIIKIFYSSDDIDNYQRLIKDLSYKVVTYLDSVFALGILEEEPGKFILSVPVSLGYWSYMSSAWMNTVSGTFAFSTGLDLITNDKAFQDLKRKTYVAWSFNIEYRHGLGKYDVELQSLHIISFSFPVRIHIESLSKDEGVFLGFGVSYEFDIASIEEMYVGKKRYLYTHIGMLGSFGYQWRLNEKMRIAFDNTILVGFQNHPMISYSPRVRLLYSIYSKDVIDKWK
jgi:hypothetical protein